jgi:hypothetical protein
LLNIFNIPKIFRRFEEFDKVTKFRLQNSYLIAVAMSILAPILIILKGTLLLPWVVSVFAILNTLSVKMNDYIVNNYTLDQVYKAGVLIHISLTLGACIYFISPMVMIIMDSTLAIIETAVFSSYSVMLNNYLTNEYPNSMSSFQIVRNSSWADGALIGLLYVTIVTFFFPLSAAVISFIVFNSLFGIWLLKNRNFFKDIKIS